MNERKEWMIVSEYQDGDMFAYEFWYRKNAENSMEFFAGTHRRITLLKRSDAVGCDWEAVCYVDKEGRHDISR